VLHSSSSTSDSPGDSRTPSLIDKKIMEGAFIWAPLRIIGATGSPGNPIVLY